MTTTYTYAGEDILREVRGGTILRYSHGPGVDEPLAADDGTSLSYFHADGLGSVVKTTDATGAVTLTRQYDAWGVLSVGTSEPGHAFTGREWDPELGLYYYRARYYEPQNGTFLSEDPLGIRQKDLNGYLYVSANPVAFVDPYGLTKTGWPKAPPPLCPKYPRRRPCQTGICGVVRDENPWTGKAVCYVIWYLKNCERTVELIVCSQIPPEWDHECEEITVEPPLPTYTPPPPKCPPGKPCGPF